MDLATRPYHFDDHMIQETRGDHQPRVHVYQWQGVAVVIGRGGKQELELDTAEIAQAGVPLYKRRGGGCAVVLDPGNIIVSVALPVPGLAGIKTAFGALSSWLCAALAQLEINGVQQLGVSDLVLVDRKIGGSCIWRTRNFLYYSTTLLVAPDLDLVERFLPHPPREPDYRRGRPHRDFMGSLTQTPSVESVQGFTQQLNRALQGSLSGINITLSPSNETD